MVDDRRRPRTGRWTCRSGTVLQVVPGPARGPAAARNAGWRATATPWVAFLDDDVLAGAGLGGRAGRRPGRAAGRRWPGRRAGCGCRCRPTGGRPTGSAVTAGLADRALGDRGHGVPADRRWCGPAGSTSGSGGRTGRTPTWRCGCRRPAGRWSQGARTVTTRCGRRPAGCVRAQARQRRRRADAPAARVGLAPSGPTRPAAGCRRHAGGHRARPAAPPVLGLLAPAAGRRRARCGGVAGGDGGVRGGADRAGTADAGRDRLTMRRPRRRSRRPRWRTGCAASGPHRRGRTAARRRRSRCCSTGTARSCTTSRTTATRRWSTRCRARSRRWPGCAPPACRSGW